MERGIFDSHTNQRDFMIGRELQDHMMIESLRSQTNLKTYISCYQREPVKILWPYDDQWDYQN